MSDATNTFTHDRREYDLTKLIILLRPRKVFLLPIKDLLWVLKYDKPDEDRVNLAKHRFPLIVTKYRGKWTVVDGLHRLEKYRRKGIKVITVKEATPDLLKQCLIGFSSSKNIAQEGLDIELDMLLQE